VWFLKWALSVAFAIAFAVLVQREQDVARVLGAFVLGAGLFGVIGILTYLGSGGLSRGQGLTGDPNQFASFEALAVPAALALAGSDRWAAWRPLLYLSIPVSVLSIVASFSRGGFVTLAVVVLATLAISWRVFFRRRTQKVTYVALLAIAGVLILSIGSTAYEARLGTILSGSDRGSGRTDLWAAAWHGYTHHPYLGLGAGGFEAQSLELLQTTPGVDTTAPYVAAGRPVHNAYFEPLVDLGPVGLALFLVLVGFTFWYLVGAAKRFRISGRRVLWRMSMALLVSYVGLCTAIVFLSIELGHMLWAFVGLAVALDGMSRRELRPAVAGEP
jgi:O-antigen ligase